MAISKIVKTDDMQYEKVLNIYVYKCKSRKNKKKKTQAQIFLTIKQCVIVDGRDGIMILMKNTYLINMIDQQ